MNTHDDEVRRYAHLWSDSPHRWVIWHAVDGTMVFDTVTNCPESIDDGPALRGVLRRMREAGAPETNDYPGGPC
ncbi:hypothetical protein AF335_20475 [Streptomyces eurocidicus]|uniref:Uncharacterized protein n=1 Tax=Streptomyces eurocidicus TaxID=66423 RepID=A0A2N8NTL1_STREU|nr:hypothetical protein [Streptomyces eurocidicus]MBB5122905.1 hypothetical protein [Streptomyces eurocidicus]MBF6056531.1 hypothetical protein [Streptomyces eurocidicus]PNE32115.1 hypothetical protein AF335_20475 [Streptomyces eurocidicus]